MTLQHHTAYQRTHVVVRRLEQPCPYLGPIGPTGKCPECGRYPLAPGKRTRSHRPNVHYAYGTIERYGDGSTRFVPPHKR